MALYTKITFFGLSLLIEDTGSPDLT